METIKIYAEKTSNGNILREEVPVEKLSNDSYELLASPGLALNLAKGDRFRFVDENTPVEVLQRSGNLCIQFFSDAIPVAAIRSIERRVAEELNGTVDGYTERNVVITVSVELGFPTIEQVVGELAIRLTWSGIRETSMTWTMA
ncbi:DUF4265 domain-containing protein [Pseudomonas mangiferae]|nr:DUF4265 domain-containing protein [Pseudomonas mangiferae]